MISPPHLNPMKLKAISIYTPDSALRHPIRMLTDMFYDLFAGRELAWRLTVRDINAQYRQTALGLLWVFILPLAHTFTWIFLSGSGIVRVSETNLPYPVYVFSGTMLWAIFMDAVNSPLRQTTNAKQMLAKIIGAIWVLSGLLWLFRPESLKRRLAKKMSRKFRFIIYGFILMFGIVIIGSVFKAEGIIAKLVGLIGIIISIKAILLLTSKTSDKIVGWFAEKPIKFFRIIACVMIIFGIMLYLA